MNDNRSSTPLAVNTTPRRWLAGAISAAVLVVLVVAPTAAAVGGISGSASTGRTAVRFADPTDLAFPIEPTPTCLVLNNYGGYSKRYGASGHQGVDIGADERQPVYAVEPGILYEQWTDVDDAPGLGWGLWSVTDTRYRYYHLADFAPDLKIGSLVSKGQLIGYVGDTGNASKGGWHLHFEVHPGPAPYRGTVDPVPLLPVPTACTVYKRSGS